MAERIVTAIKKVVRGVRDFLGRPEIARWITPYRKPAAGLLAGALVGLARDVGVLDELPAGWSEVVAFAVVSYFMPERTEPPKALVVEAPGARMEIDTADAKLTEVELQPPIPDEPPEETPEHEGLV